MKTEEEVDDITGVDEEDRGRIVIMWIRGGCE